MPLLTVNIASKTFDEIRTLVERGFYSGLDQFMEVAALNQLALERGTSPADLKARGHRKAPATTAPRAAASSVSPSPIVSQGANKQMDVPSGRNSRTPVARRRFTATAVPVGDVNAFREHTSAVGSNGTHPEP